MKSRMKKLTIRSLPAFVLTTTLLFLLGTAMANLPNRHCYWRKGPAVDPVAGTGLTQLVLSPPPEGIMMQFEGSVDLFVRGELKTAHLMVNVYLIVENAAGVQYVLASHISDNG
jgi:hypothetical protein